MVSSSSKVTWGGAGAELPDEVFHPYHPARHLAHPDARFMLALHLLPDPVHPDGYGPQPVEVGVVGGVVEIVVGDKEESRRLAGEAAHARGELFPRPDIVVDDDGFFAREDEAEIRVPAAVFFVHEGAGFGRAPPAGQVDAHENAGRGFLEPLRPGRARKRSNGARQG